MVSGPTGIEGVREAEEAFAWGSRVEGLPGFVLIAGAAEHDNAIDALVQGEACGGGCTVGSAGDDDLIPTDLGVEVEKLLPVAFGVLFGQVQ